MQMATMGVAICMGRVVDRNWTKVIYAAAMVTACCKFGKIVGPARVEPASTITYVLTAAVNTQRGDSKTNCQFLTIITKS